MSAQDITPDDSVAPVFLDSDVAGPVPEMPAYLEEEVSTS